MKTYRLEKFFQQHHSFLARFDEKFLHYESRSPYHNAVLLYDAWNDMARKRYKYELFFSLITSGEYENVVRKFYEVVSNWKINSDVITMFNTSEKTCFFIALRKYLKKFKNNFSFEDKTMLITTREYNVVRKIFERKLDEKYYAYESLSFYNNPKRAFKIYFRAKKIETFIRATLDILDRFQLIVPDYRFVYNDRYLRIRIKFLRAYDSHQNKMTKCRIISSRLPLDVCVHVLYQFL
jgi:hypothetical protein